GSHPAISDGRAGLFDGDLPDREHVLVGALVEAAVIAVAEQFFLSLRVDLEEAGHFEHRLLSRGHRDVAETGPGKVLHPRRMARDGVDLLDLRERLRRVPPVVPLDLDAVVAVEPFENGCVYRRVAAVAIDDGDA